MIHIVFGLVGFCWNGGKVKGYRHENKDAYVFCAFFGLFGIIAWNFNGMQLWMRVFRLAVDDAVLLEKFHETLDERVKKGMKEREEQCSGIWISGKTGIPGIGSKRRNCFLRQTPVVMILKPP